ncbi:hypothetical protein ACLMJK_004418 [Lecanora helva]
MFDNGPATRSRSKSKRVNPREPMSGARKQPNAANRPSLDIKIPPQKEYSRRENPDETVIGLALGSPGQSPRVTALPQFDNRDAGVSHDAAVPDNRNSVKPPQRGLGITTEIGSGGQAVKRKSSKWKSISSFFGKRRSANPGPEGSTFYQLDKIPEQESTKLHATRDQVENPSLRRKRADSSKTGTDSSQSTTKGEGAGLFRRTSSRRKGQQRRKIGELDPEMSRLHNALSTQGEPEDPQLPPVPSTAVASTPAAPLLQVDIPNIEMDRYSVMFRDVLRTPGSRSPYRRTPLSTPRRARSAERSPAISRRGSSHASINDLLQTPHAAHQRKDPPSARSSKTTSFSLFPSSTSNPRHSGNGMLNKPLPKPSPLGPSRTASNTLAPPRRPSIQKSKSDDQDHVFIFVHNPEKTPSTPGTNSRRHSLGSPLTSANSTRTSFFEAPESRVGPDLALDFNPPANQTTLDHRSLPARQSSVKKLAQQFNESDRSSSSLEPRYPSGAAAAEISIARQISITRRQQKLLVPVPPKLAQQPRQPTLVNGMSNPAARKSHHLLLEDA